ncbi:MAG: hypothetical protein R3E61_08630 [Pseudomonadales bacterium]
MKSCAAQHSEVSHGASDDPIVIFSQIICLLLQNIVLLPSALADELITLCYHDVRDDVDGHLDADTVAVSSKQLAEQFEWLRQNGYTPVSVNQLEDAPR